MLIRSAACVVERRCYNDAPGIVLGNNITTADRAHAGDIYRSAGAEPDVEKMAETHKRVEQWLATNVTGSQASSHVTRHCRLLLAAALFVLGWSGMWLVCCPTTISMMCMASCTRRYNAVREPPFCMLTMRVCVIVVTQAAAYLKQHPEGHFCMRNSSSAKDTIVITM